MKTVKHANRFYVVEDWPERPLLYANEDNPHEEFPQEYKDNMDRQLLMGYEAALTSAIQTAIPVDERDYEKVRELIVTDIRSGFNEVDTLLKVVMIQDLTPYSVPGLEFEEVKMYSMGHRETKKMLAGEKFEPRFEYMKYRIKQSTK